MKTCDRCQHQNPTNSNYCNQCGFKLTLTEVDHLVQPLSSESKKTKRSAERRQLTILFCDLVGSTPLSEQLDPEEYREVITNYHQVAEKVIKQQGGHIAQYLGDGLLVYFGYPEGLEDAPRASVSAGLGILDAMQEANKKWEEAGKIRVKVRIGIHTGLVVVDDHLALGETVNVAARLEGLAPHNGLVISPQTMALVQGWFEINSLGKHTLKGISEPMEIFQVIKESGAVTRLDVAKGKGLSPLVGRDFELEQIAQRWESVKNGHGNILLLNGEAGIGKSRLIDTIEKMVINESGSKLMVARCSAYQKNSTFHPIIEMFEKTLLSFLPDDSSDSKIHKLERFVLQSGLDFKSIMPLMAEYFSIISEDFPPLFMSPVAKRQKTLQTIMDLVLRQASEQPVVFVLEDLHWADASTLEWLHLLIENLHDHSIFTLCTTRPAYKPEWSEYPYAEQINLERLSKKNLGAICNHLSSGKAFPNEIIEQITEKTEGVPLFVEELTKMIIESGMLVEKEDRYEVADTVETLAIPSTLQDSLLARLDRLSDVKEVVQLGSVLGREFTFEMLKTVLPKKEDKMEQSLSKLLDAEIFNKRGNNGDVLYQFKHALIQETAYGSMLNKHRQHLHHKVANVLEHQFEEKIQKQPELLAHHYTEASRPLNAIPLWLRAGQMASQKNASSEAIAHLEKGLGLLPNISNELERNNVELDYYLTLGGTYVVSHGFPHPKVKETFDKASDITQNMQISPKLALVLMNLLSYYFNTEDYVSHQELADYVMELTKDKEHGYWFELVNNQLGKGVVVIKGDLNNSVACLDRILKIFDPSKPFPWELTPSGYIEVGAKAWGMQSLLILGQLERAKQLYDNHLSFTRDHKDSMTLYHIYTFPALYNLERREWKLAENILENYLPIVKEFGDPVFILTADVYYCIARGFQKDKSAFDKGVSLVNTCYDIGFRAFASYVAHWIGEIYYEFGDYYSALSWTEKIMSHIQKSGSDLHKAELYRIKGLTFKALGRPETMVEECFHQSIKTAEKQSAMTYKLRSTLELAKLWQSQGNIKDSYKILKEIYGWFGGTHDLLDLKNAKLLLAELEK